MINYENKVFSGSENVWVEKYQNLSNITHWHLEPEIVFIQEGKGEVYVDGAIYHANKGEAFFIDSGQVHYIKSSESIIITIQIKQPLLLQVEKYALISPKLTSTYDVSSLYHKIRKYERSNEKFANLCINSCIQELIYNIFSQEKSTLKEEINPTPNNMKQILGYIYNNISYVSFKEVLDKFGYSSGYFSRLFKKSIGVTFSEYLNICRIQKAKALLLEGQIKIDSVSQACGFNSIRHFDRVFKSLTGFSPSSLTQKGSQGEQTMTVSNGFDPTLSSSKIIIE